MQIQINSIQTEYSYPLHEPYALEDILFFDIETTGFSPKTSSVYLIGGVYYKEGAWQLIQWLGDEPLKESILLEAFAAFAKSYKKIIHYNGTGFDIPFLQKKAEIYGLDDPFALMESVDLYKLIQPFKRILSLESLKLKSLEEYLKLPRKDTYSGEELIPIYSGYVGRLIYERMRKTSETTDISSPLRSAASTEVPDSESLRDILLLHNAEDVTNLLPLSGMLYFCDTFTESFLTETGAPMDYRLTDSADAVTLDLLLPVRYPYKHTITCPLKEKGTLKKGVSFLPDMEISIIFDKDTLRFIIPVYTGALKYFLSPASDYFYLPLEDTAIHKSVAQYVDKEFRQKAKPANCYLKKESRFVAVYENLSSNAFKNNYSDRIAYIEADKLNEFSSKEMVHWVKGLIYYIKDFFRL